MHLDHVSYATSHDQLADTVQRIGSRLGSAFVDGGIHPRFGTRNFTCALKNHQYVEIVCPLEHPATEHTAWGNAVSQKVREGGGWLTWVFSTENISTIETKFGRKSIEGTRIRPNGSKLSWKQIGVKEISDSRELPFFIQWLSFQHPSQDGLPAGTINKIVLASEHQLSNSWFKNEILNSLNPIKLEWLNLSEIDGEPGIISIHFETPHGIVDID